MWEEIFMGEFCVGWDEFSMEGELDFLSFLKTIRN